MSLASLKGVAPVIGKRVLGKTNLEVSVLGFGAAEIGYEDTSPSLVDRLLGVALDGGLNVIDTAECYRDSEDKIGRALVGRRKDCFVFTKCGHAAGFRTTPATRVLNKVFRSVTGRARFG